MEVLSRNGSEIRFGMRMFIRWPLLESRFVVRAQVDLPRGIRMESESISLPASLVLSGYRAEFAFEEIQGKTNITHSESFVTRDSILGRLAERFADDWLVGHMQDVKLPRLKTLLERS